MLKITLRLLITIGIIAAASISAQAENGSPILPRAKPPISKATATKIAVNNTVPAKKLFGAAKKSAHMRPAAIGFYSKGCLAGAQQLPVNGPAWQAMRLSRNRNWGHPVLIKLVERLALEAQKYDGWPGLLVGDLSQPRGGPMLTGHASHQVGLDADIWLTPMPNRTLTRKERENISAISVIKDRRHINPKIWTDAHAKLIKRAASYPEVERIFVHPPIKKALCDKYHNKGAWLAKVRPYYGHNYHFHIRIKCPKGSTNCRPQGTAKAEDGTGCGKQLAYWMGPKPWRPAKPAKKPKPNKKPVKKRQITLDNLPKECRMVLRSK